MNDQQRSRNDGAVIGVRGRDGKPGLGCSLAWSWHLERVYRYCREP